MEPVLVGLVGRHEQFEAETAAFVGELEQGVLGSLRGVMREDGDAAQRAQPWATSTARCAASLASTAVAASGSSASQKYTKYSTLPLGPG